MSAFFNVGKRNKPLRFDKYFLPEEIAIVNALKHWLIPRLGGRLNKKDGLTRYGDSHVKDKTS